MIADNANKWWFIGLRGLIAFVFGIFLIFVPGRTLLLLLQIFSIYLLADGAIRLVMVYRKQYEDARLFHLILGIAGILTGVFVLGVPLLNIEVTPTFQTIVGVVIGLQAILMGLLVMLNARTLTGQRRMVTFFGGIGSIVLGVVTAISALNNDASLVPVIGIAAVSYGSIYLYLAYLAYQAQAAQAKASQTSAPTAKQ